MFSTLNELRKISTDILKMYQLSAQWRKPGKILFLIVCKFKCFLWVPLCQGATRAWATRGPLGSQKSPGAGSRVWTTWPLDYRAIHVQLYIEHTGPCTVHTFHDPLRYPSNTGDFILVLNSYKKKLFGTFNSKSIVVHIIVHFSEVHYVEVAELERCLAFPAAPHC